MKTDELIRMLSTGVIPVRQGTVLKRFLVSLGATAAGAMILMLTVFGLRPDLNSVLYTPLFWLKLIVPAFFAAGAWAATLRLSRPESIQNVKWWPLLLPLALLWMGAAWWLEESSPGGRWTQLLGQTWRTCPFNIFLLSLPGLAVMLRAMKAQAPTNLRLAGACSGLLAGAVSTIVYCFHCPEMSPAFWAIWYVTGMILPALLGSLIAPRMLRW
jgi:hypothetical protein